MYVETEGGSVLCDPWFSPAYFASWFVFPRNDRLDVSKFLKPDYLYISHLHHDHYDPEWLKANVDKSTTVLLPAFRVDHLEVALRGCGFSNFIQTEHGVTSDLGGLEIAILAMTAPADGPAGDSAIVIADSTARILNQNDSRPRDADEVKNLGPYHGHFTQFSGAIWYPMVYDFDDAEKERLGRRKRDDQETRALAYIKDADAKYVFPCAGPPCFLDESLFELNDLNGDPSNIFPDQPSFLEYLEKNDVEGGRLVVPGSVITLDGDNCSIVHPGGEAAPEAIFADKRKYLKQYQSDQKAILSTTLASLPRNRYDILNELSAWWGPILEMAPLTRAGVGSPILLRLTDETNSTKLPLEIVPVLEIVIDFPAGTVRNSRDIGMLSEDAFAYTLTMERGLVEWCIENHAEDWVNEIFLSCRFTAHRESSYNEYVYTFFKCLSVERMAFCEGYYASRSSGDETFICGDYEVQRRCPHLRADLTRFGTLRDGHILHCQVHGWEFDLETGKCLNADSPENAIKSRRIS